jgi:uncharacterized iron-regulated membrane protein
MSSTFLPEAPPHESSSSEPHGKRAKKQERKTPLYQIVWRWHFYAGLLTAPLLLFITITGMIYVFRTELTHWRDRDILYVTPVATRVSYDELRERALKASSSGELEALFVHPEANRSIHFVAHHHPEGADHSKEQHEQLYFDPYTGELLGKRIAEQDFFYIILWLHRSLLSGTPGRIIIELVTGWGLILLATGLYLWWPRGKKNVGVWLPRTKGKFYAVLRDWHAVPGAYLFPVAFLVMATGLFFSYTLGNTFNASVKKAGHWPREWFGPSESRPAPEEATPVSLDRIVATLLTFARPHDSIGIRLATGPKLAHKAFFMRDEDKNSLKMVAVDQYTGEVVDAMDSSQVPPLYKVRLLAVSIHMGQIFGMPTKILALVTSLGICAMTVTGVWMWWIRRPIGQTGFPRRPIPRSLPFWGWGVVILTGIVLPTTGISMVVVFIVNALVGRWTQEAVA